MITLEFDSNNTQFKKRRRQILNLIKNISNESNLNIEQKYEKGSLEIYITDKDERIEEYYFNTINKQYLANYRETWVKIVDNKFKLKEINLGIYNFNDEYTKEYPNGEFILLHTEPNYEPKEDENITKNKIIYKQSPHSHVECASHPIPKAHLALNISNIITVTENLENLEKALFNSIILIKEEIFDRK